MCNKEKRILFYSGYGVQMHIDNARSKDMYHIHVYTWPIRCCVHIRLDKVACLRTESVPVEPNGIKTRIRKLESMYFNISFRLDIIVR